MREYSGESDCPLLRRQLSARVFRPGVLSLKRADEEFSRGHFQECPKPSLTALVFRSKRHSPLFVVGEMDFIWTEHGSEARTFTSFLVAVSVVTSFLA